MALSDGTGVTSAVGRMNVIMGSGGAEWLARVGSQGCPESGLGSGRGSPNNSSRTRMAVALVSMFILVVIWIHIQTYI